MTLNELVQMFHPYDTYITLTSRSNEDLFDGGYAAAFQNYSYTDRLDREVFSYRVDRREDTGRRFVAIEIY